MVFLKKAILYFLYFLLSILLYMLFSILISYITIHKNTESIEDIKTIYLHSNGVHLSVILPFKEMTDSLKKDMNFKRTPKYVKYGWGDENFYLNVPKWKDFKFKYAFGAFFLDNPTVMHITYKYRRRKNWIAVKVSKEELKKINNYITNSFQINLKGDKVLIPQKMYGNNSFFYKAKGSYSPVKTCNTWVNDCFKYSGLKASYWTILDFGLLNKYNK